MKKSVVNTVKELTNAQIILQGNKVLKQERFIFASFNALKKEQKDVHTGAILNRDFAQLLKRVEKTFIVNSLDLIGCATPQQLVKWFANGGQFNATDIFNLAKSFEALEVPQRAVVSEFGAKFNNDILKALKMEGADLYAIFQNVLTMGGKKALVKPSLTIAKLVVKFAPQLVAKNPQIVDAFANVAKGVAPLEGFEAHLSDVYKLTATAFYSLAKANKDVTLPAIVQAIATADKAKKQAEQETEKQRKSIANPVGMQEFVPVNIDKLGA